MYRTFYAWGGNVSKGNTVSFDHVLGSDIKLAEYFLGSDLRIDRGDLSIVSSDMNLAQALLHRLRTVKGELAELGHPDYGSTILEFIGQPNDATTRARLRLAIRDTIRQEPRVREIISITVKPRIGPDGTSEKSPSTNSSKKGIRMNMASKSLTDDLLTAEEDGFRDNSHLDIDRSQQSILFASNDMLNTVDIDLVVLPVGEKSSPVELAFPFTLEVVVSSDV